MGLIHDHPAGRQGPSDLQRSLSIAAVQSDRVSLALSGNTSPGLIRLVDKDGDDIPFFDHVIMPMQEGGRRMSGRPDFTGGSRESNLALPLVSGV